MHTVQKDVPNARNQANNDVGVAGQRADRKALGEASVKADIGIEAKGNNDNRRCQFIPRGLYEGLQQGVCAEARHGNVLFRPTPQGNQFLPLHAIRKENR